MKKINLEEFNKLKKLAHLEINAEKSNDLLNDCNNLLTHIALLNEVDTSALDADFKLPQHGNLPIEKDEVLTSFTTEEALINAPSKQAIYFKVPRVIEGKSEEEIS